MGGEFGIEKYQVGRRTREKGRILD